MLWETLKLALQAILRNPTRSFLTVLGVVIGVAAVIAMVTIGAGSTAQVTRDVESMGTNLLMISPGQDRMGPGGADGAARPFDLDDVDQIVADLASIATAAPSATTQAVVIQGNANHKTRVTGTDARYLTATDWPLTAGRAFTPAEERGSSVCIIGQTVREELFGARDPLGQDLRIKTVTCEVIGVLTAKGASSFGTDQDDIVMIPFKTYASRIAGSQDVPLIYAAMRDGVSTDRATRDLTALLREIRRLGTGEDDDFTIRSMEQLASMLTGITSVLTGMLSAVAAVSLLVGGIGIMNIMLVSVTERTREIGIRMSVGAQSRQVLMQFLVEAIVLSGLGGVLGVVLGLGMGAVGSDLLNVPFAPEPGVIVLAVAFSAIVGVVFGYFPARRAARMDPIEALRH